MLYLNSFSRENTHFDFESSQNDFVSKPRGLQFDLLILVNSISCKFLNSSAGSTLFMWGGVQKERFSRNFRMLL